MMNIDSMPAISIVTEPKFNSQSKHIKIKYHFIIEKAENGEIEIFYAPYEELMADSLTKPLLAEVLARHVIRMGLVYV